MPLPAARTDVQPGRPTYDDLIRAGAEEGFDDRAAETLATRPVLTAPTHHVRSP